MARRPRRSWGKIHEERSGRFQASYMHNLTRHAAPATFTKRMDAERWLADERRLIEHETWTPPRQRAAEKHARTKNLETYAAEWIAHRDLKPRTRQGYEELLAGPIKPLGRLALGNINPETVRAWHAGMGTKTPTKKAHAYGLLHAVLATAVTDGWIAVNPCNIPRAMNPPTKRQPVILEPAEVAKLADAIRPEKLRCLVLVSAWCGLRWGEVIELRRKDISADCSVITVARGATHRHKDSERKCEISTPKSGRGRSVVVPPHIREDLAEHMERFVAEGPEALVFPAERGCHLNDRVFRDYFTEALKSIGREGVRIHDLRHYAGTQAARVGNLREQMSRLGHSTVSAAMRYQGMVDSRAHEVAAELSKLAAVKPETNGEQDAQTTG